MPQVFEMFDGSGPGAYFFFHAGGRKWVVADLESGVSWAADRMVRFDIRDNLCDLSELFDEKVRRGRLREAVRVGDRCLVPFDTAVPFFRDHKDDIDLKATVVYDVTGEASVAGAAVLENLAGVVGRIGKKHEDYRDDK